MRDIEAAMDAGQVVFAVLSGSFLDIIALQDLLAKHDLPPLEAVIDEPRWFSQVTGVPSWKPRRSPGKGDGNKRGSDNGPRVSAIALPYQVRSTRQREIDATDARLQTLLRWQRDAGTRVLLVPCTFLWSKTPPSATPSPIDRVLGTESEPRRLRRLSQALLNRRQAVFRHASPLEVSLGATETVERASVRLRRQLVRTLLKEKTLVQGPTRKSPGRVLEELMRSPRVQRHVGVEARVSGREQHAVETEVRNELRKLAAIQDPTALRWLHRGLQWTWQNIYQGVEVDEPGIERLRAAARDGGIVLVPSHRSHFDYLVLSDVLYQYAMSPPLIAAGENLNFWPVGPLLRRGGAFFIRRSFRGQKLYPALVEAYVRKLLREGYSIEFFIEGGRSRTGRVLSAKLGLLSMLLDSALLLRDRDVFFVPISVTYDRVPEVPSYVREQLGGEKEGESVLGLAHSAQKLRRNHGKIYVNFGTIQSMRDTVRTVRKPPTVADSKREAGAPDESLVLRPKERRSVVQALANQIINEIAGATLVTPVALVASALLLGAREGRATVTNLRLLTSDASALLSRMHRHGAPLASALRGQPSKASATVIWQALRLLESHELVTIVDNSSTHSNLSVADEARLELDFYRNTVSHFVMTEALLAAVLLAFSGPVSRKAWLERTHLLARLMREALPPGLTTQAEARIRGVLDEVLVADALVAADIVTAHANAAPDGTPREDDKPAEDLIYAWCGGKRCIYRVAAQIMPDIESVVLAIDVLRELTAEPVARSEWFSRAKTLHGERSQRNELCFSESQLKPRLDNALKVVAEAGLLAEGDEGSIAPSGDFESAAINLTPLVEIHARWCAFSRELGHETHDVMPLEAS